MNTRFPISGPSPAADLSELHAQYIDAVNRAVAEGRDDLVAALAADYPNDAAALMGARALAA